MDLREVLDGKLTNVTYLSDRGGGEGLGDFVCVGEGKGEGAGYACCWCQRRRSGGL